MSVCFVSVGAIFWWGMYSCYSRKQLRNARWSSGGVQGVFWDGVLLFPLHDTDSWCNLCQRLQRTASQRVNNYNLFRPASGPRANFSPYNQGQRVVQYIVSHYLLALSFRIPENVTQLLPIILYFSLISLPILGIGVSSFFSLWVLLWLVSSFQEDHLELVRQTCIYIKIIPSSEVDMGIYRLPQHREKRITAQTFWALSEQTQSEGFKKNTWNFSCNSSFHSV